MLLLSERPDQAAWQLAVAGMLLRLLLLVCCRCFCFYYAASAVLLWPHPYDCRCELSPFVWQIFRQLSDQQLVLVNLQKVSQNTMRQRHQHVRTRQSRGVINRHPSTQRQVYRASRPEGLACCACTSHQAALAQTQIELSQAPAHVQDQALAHGVLQP